MTRRAVQIPNPSGVEAAPSDAGRGSRDAPGSSMKRRLQWSYLTVTALVLVTLQVPLGWLFAQYEYEDLAATALVAANAFSDLVLGPLGEGDTAALDPIVEAFSDHLGGTVVVFDQDGEAVAAAMVGDHSTELADHPDVAAALRGERVSAPRSYERPPAAISVAAPVVADGELIGAIDIIMPTSAVDARVRTVWLALAGFTVTVLVGLALLGGRLTTWAIKPLGKLERAARAWANGDLSARAEIDSGPAELRALGATADLMARQLEHIVEGHRAALSEASHELRLPLTAYRLRLANLEPFVAEDARRRLDELDEDLVAFQRRLDRLVGLTRGPMDSRQPVDVIAAVRARHDFWIEAAALRRVGLEVEVCAGVDGELVACEIPGTLDEILDNLIANALAVSPPGTVVRMCVAPGVETIDVHVVDQGPGMSPEARRRAMETLLRTGPARGMRSGLGLAIVQRLATAMEASIELSPAKGRGLDAAVRLKPITGRPATTPLCDVSSGCHAYGCPWLAPSGADASRTPADTIRDPRTPEQAEVSSTDPAPGRPEHAAGAAAGPRGER
jgi:signal transduction histidine kinase